MKRKYFTKDEWKKRVDPTFVRYWAATKKSWNLSEIQDLKERERLSRGHFEELAAASRQLPRGKKAPQVWRAIMAGPDGEGPFVGREVGVGYIQSPESSALFRQLVFLKYGITFRELLVELELKPKAHRKLMLVHELYHRFRTGKVRLDDLKLKFKPIHFQIMVEGFELGLRRLNEGELEACFDEICPCAQRHSGEYQRKRLIGIKKACEHVLESASKPTTIKLGGA